MDLRAVLATSPAFAGLSAKALSLIAEAAREQLVRSGEVLFEQGDRSHGLYVIASGRLALTVPGTDGEARRLRELGRGEVVGGVSLLSGEGRTTGVVALRDSLLVVVSKAHFDRISEQHPHDAVEVSRHLVKQMLLSVSARSEPPDARSLNTIALVPGHPGLDMQGIGDALSAALSAYGPSVRIDAERVDGALGAGAARAKFEAEVDSGRVTTWLGGMEARYRTLVYTSDDTDTPWTRRALRQADRVLVVVDGAASHRETPMIKLLRALDLNVPVELLVVHVAGARRRAEPAEWVDLCGACGHQHVMGRDAADFGRVARLLTGHGLGLVLGGGGARGCAHLGLLKAVEELGLEFDVVGGTSMGAYVGALMVTGHNFDSALANVRETFVGNNYLNDYVVPRVALISGKKFLRKLDEVFGDQRIEDLNTTFYCVSTNLSAGEAVVHRQGLLRDWLAASMAVPGIAPPLLWQGDLICDGGVLDSLPIGAMRNLAQADIVACDVSNSERFTVPGADSLDKPVPLRFQRGVDGFPNIARILHRAATVVSADEIAARATTAECYVHMPVAGIGMFDWDNIDDIVEAGYEHALPLLQQFMAKRQRPGAA